MRRIWPRVVKIYWDPWRNIPVVRPRQREIDLFYAVKLTEPGDARPAFGGDREKLREATLYEYGSDKVYSRFFENVLVLLNKVPHWDVMYEVVSSGNVYGQLYFDPFRWRWRFRLTHAGAFVAVEEGLVDSLTMDGPIYVGREIPAPSTSQRQLVLLDKRGLVRGLGEIYSEKLVVVKTFHERTMPIETDQKPSSIEDVLKSNEEGLTRLEERSVRYLKRLREKFNLPVTVSYSGGKDSLVALDIAYKAFGGDIELVFNDTGLELPETINNVKHVSESYGLKLHVASAGDVFWSGVKLFGPPGKDYRWCCKITKLVPLAKLTRALWPNGALNIVGQRAYESLDRAKSPRIWRNKWIPHMLTTTPIQDWSQLECWLYIFRYKLPYNKLYERGFDRLGCFLCPSSAVAEFHDVAREYPELWLKWERGLDYWREKTGQPAEWIKLGLWRWLTPSTAKKRIARHVENYTVDWRKEYTLRLLNNTARLAPLEISRDDEGLKIVFNRDVLTPEIKGVVEANMKNLGYEVSYDEIGIHVKSGNAHITISGPVLALKYLGERREEAFEDMVDLLKVIYRSSGCLKCGSCILWSGRGAAKLTDRGPVPLRQIGENEKRFYLEACPISDQLVEKVVLALIADNPKVYKRKSRRRIITWKMMSPG